MRRFGMLKLSKKSLKVEDSFYENEKIIFYTASMIKIVYADLLLGLNEDLSQIVSINDKDIVSSGGIFHLLSTKGKHQISLELALVMMLVLSDNTCTNIVLNVLKKHGDINMMIYKKYNMNILKSLDYRIDKNFVGFVGGGETNIEEFLLVLHYILYKGKFASQIKELLAHQYIKGRGLRHISEDIASYMGDKTGQLDNLLNDCGFFETNTSIYLYVVSVDTKEDYRFEYGVENRYSKEIGKLIYDTYMNMNML